MAKYEFILIDRADTPIRSDYGYDRCPDREWVSKQLKGLNTPRFSYEWKKNDVSVKTGSFHLALKGNDHTGYFVDLLSTWSGLFEDEEFCSVFKEAFGYYNQFYFTTNATCKVCESLMETGVWFGIKEVINFRNFKHIGGKFAEIHYGKSWTPGVGELWIRVGWHGSSEDVWHSSLLGFKQDYTRTVNKMLKDDNYPRVLFITVSCPTTTTKDDKLLEDLKKFFTDKGFKSIIIGERRVRVDTPTILEPTSFYQYVK